MKILHIDTETGFRGGERQVQLLMEGLRDRGHECLVAGPVGGRLPELMSSKGFPVWCWKKPRVLGVRSPFLIRAIRKMAQEFSADIIHAHTGNAHTLAWLAFAGHRPVVVTRRVDFPVQANWFSRRKYTHPGIDYIAISTAIRHALEAGGVPGRRITLVHSGVDLNRVTGGDGGALRQEWLGGAEGPLIGFVGALVDHKAPWILAEAAPLIRETLPGARIVYIGEGAERPRIEAIAARHPGIITLAGWRNDMANCYAALDLFVMPSKLEGLCTALIDALAAGVPAIASNAGGIPDVIVPGRTGELVEPLDPRALANAIIALWKDSDRRTKYAAAGIKHVHNSFTSESMVRGTEGVYGRSGGKDVSSKLKAES